jgi:delta1-piperideine-2-carboxylate reductase
MILTIDQARALAEAAMVAVGHTRLEANIIADHLIDCELRGLPFGGLARALSIAERIAATTTPRRPITVTKETPVSVSAYSDDAARVFQPSSAHRSNLMAPTIPI